MLSLECLETRTLLSLVVTDSINSETDLYLNFGNKAIGETSYPGMIQLTNDSSSLMTITGLELGSANFTINATNVNSISSSDDDLILLPGQSEKIYLRFTPQGFGPDATAAITDTLTITRANGSKKYVRLAGTTSGADLVILDNSLTDFQASGLLSFQSLETSETATDPLAVTLVNNSNVSLAYTDIDFDPSQDRGYIITDSPTDGSFDPGDTVTMTMPFVPDSNYYYNSAIEFTGPTTSYSNSVLPVGFNDNYVDFGDVLVGQDSFTYTLALQNNSSGTDLKIYSIALADANSSFEISTETDLTDTIIAAGSATPAYVQVTLHPEWQGDFIDTVVIKTNDGMGSYSVQLVGTGVEPLLTVRENSGSTTDSTVHFGWNPVGQTSQSEIVELYNSGNTAMTVTSASLSNSAFSLGRDDSSLPVSDFTIEAGESAYYYVTFTGTAATEYTSDLTFSTNGGNKTLKLTAQSAYPGFTIYNSAGVLETDYSIQLPTIGSNQQSYDYFTIRNLSALTGMGSVDLQITDISVTSGSEYFSIVSDSAFSLLPGGQRNIDVSFDSTGLDLDSYPGQITITANTQETITIDVIGNVSAPDIEVSLSELDFTEAYGNVQVGQTALLPFDITNEGTTDLVISDWTFSDSQFTLVQADSSSIGSGFTIAPGGETTVYALYQPSAAGTIDATLTINSNDINETPVIAIDGQSMGRSFEIAAGENFSFIDADGDRVIVSLSGGSAVGFLANGGLSGADIAELTVSGTTSSDTLKINVKGGLTTITNINVAGPLKAISAPEASLIDDTTQSAYDLYIANDIAKIELYDIYNGASIYTGIKTYYKLPTIAVDITAHDIGDAIFAISQPLDTLSARTFNGGSLTTPSIEKIDIDNGRLAAVITATQGDIEKVSVNGNLSGSLLAAGNIGKVSVKKDLTGTLRAVEIDKISGRNLDTALISAASLINKVTLKGDIVDSQLLSGFDIGMDGTAQATDTLNSGDIQSIKFGGRLDNSYLAAGVIDSYIFDSLGLTGDTLTSGAGTLGKIRGDEVTADNNGVEFGLYYDSTDAPSTNLTTVLDFVIKRITE